MLLTCGECRRSELRPAGAGAELRAGRQVLWDIFTRPRHHALCNGFETDSKGGERQSADEKDEYELEGGQLLTGSTTHDPDDQDQENVA